MYDLTYRSRFVKVIKGLDQAIQKKIIQELERLVVDPWRHPNIRHLNSSAPNAYRLRVGRWRILYVLIQKKSTIEVIDLFMKKSGQDYERRGF